MLKPELEYNIKPLWMEHCSYCVLYGLNLCTYIFDNWFLLAQNFNISTSNLDDFFGGPAFLAWSRMGNLHRWASSHWPLYTLYWSPKSCQCFGVVVLLFHISLILSSKQGNFLLLCSLKCIPNLCFECDQIFPDKKGNLNVEHIFVSLYFLNTTVRH